MRKLAPTLLTLLIFAQSCAHHPARSGTVVFMSDFGNQDHSVAVCKAAMLHVNPDLRIIDLTHETPPYNIRHAASILAHTVRYYPKDTVFVAVIDPGVGSARNPMAVKTKQGHYLVGPDNGVFSAIIAEEGIASAVKLENSQYYFHLREVSSTFHGRDIFSSVAAHLASGISIQDLGSFIKEPVRLAAEEAILQNGEIQGIVVRIEEPYGNILTNIPEKMLAKAGIKLGDTIRIEIGRKKYLMPYKNTFADVPVGKSLALTHSDDHLSFSVNQGNFAQQEQVQADAKIRIQKTK
jgi:S-adenosyl-L-methionine hydrolase (adenosine-forming)